MPALARIGYVRRFLSAGIGCGVAAALLSTPVAAQEMCFNELPAVTKKTQECFSFQTIDNPGDPNFNQLLGINNSFEIAGYFGDGTIVANNGYLVIPLDHFAAENPPNSTQTQVFGIDNNFPRTTVGFFQDANGNQFGFVNSKGSFTSVTDPNSGTFNGTETNQLLGLNDQQQAAGFYNDSAGNSHGYVYDIAKGTFTELKLPAGAFPNLVSFQATGINDGGVVSGFWMDQSGTMRGLIAVPPYAPKDLASVNPPSGYTNLVFSGLNANGIVVGFAVDNTGVNHGLVFNGNDGRYTVVNAPGSSPNTTPSIDNINGTLLNGIDDNNDIVGFFSDGTKLHGMLAQFQSGKF
jgi:hypothetical protein